mmetsp:Transcript_43/g.138  ORF Transcript_43/g.138 Transcript_43/m.138 type:complete len:233 (+) Transcript_43:311-1009(+)
MGCVNSKSKNVRDAAEAETSAADVPQGAAGDTAATTSEKTIASEHVTSPDEPDAGPDTDGTDGFVSGVQVFPDVIKAALSSTPTRSSSKSAEAPESESPHEASQEVTSALPDADDGSCRSTASSVDECTSAAHGALDADASSGVVGHASFDTGPRSPVPFPPLPLRGYRQEGMGGSFEQERKGPDRVQAVLAGVLGAAFAFRCVQANRKWKYWNEKDQIRIYGRDNIVRRYA